MIFKSDDSVSKRGFKLWYKSEDTSLLKATTELPLYGQIRQMTKAERRALLEELIAVMGMNAIE